MGDEVDPDDRPFKDEAEAEADSPNPFDLMRAMQPWRPMCTMCADKHSKAIMDLHRGLLSAGLDPQGEELGQAMEQAMLMGEMVARNPQMLAGFEPGTVPPYVPAIRPADLLVNGNSLCLICFTGAQAQAPRANGLVAASGGLPPGFIKGG